MTGRSRDALITAAFFVAVAIVCLVCGMLGGWMYIAWRFHV